MGTKKDIGKAFNEKFKDFEQAPDAGVWDAIATELDRGSKKFIIPLWLRLGGVVLILGLLGMLVWQPWNEKSSPNTPNTIELTDTNIKDASNLESGAHSNNRANTGSLKTVENSSLTGNNQQQKGIQVNSEEENGKLTTTNHNQTELSTSTNNESDTSQNTYTQGTQKAPLTQTLAALEKNKESTSGLSSQRSSSNNNMTLGGNTNYSATSYARTDGPFAITAQTKAILEQRRKEEIEARKAYKARIKSEREELLQTIAAQQADAKKIKDSIIEAKKAKIEAALTSKEKEKKDIKKGPKTEAQRTQDRQEAVEYEFAVSPYTSLITYGSLTRGSSIDDRLANNPREGINTVGYGVRLEYNLNDKSSVRFGVGLAPLKYQTDNFQVFNNGGIINIYQLAGLTPVELGAGGNPINPEATEFFINNTVVTLEQNISYIDIPLDYKYKLINKRVGLSINPGINVFLLTDNEIFAISEDGQKLKVGRERTLNDLSFGLNLGLSGHYNFTKNWRLDVEPAFKYQINPYSTSLGNFKPYYFGLQFGMTYKF